MQANARGEELVTERQGTILWDLSREGPDVLAMLPPSAKAVLEAIRQSGTSHVTGTTRPFEGTRFYKPEHHVRAFYQRIEDEKRAEAIIAYKGTEVWADDLAALAEHMGEGRTCINKHDFFVLTEGKTPATFLTNEALSDARKGLALFRAVRDRFPGYPKLPAPLCVIGWPSEAVERYREAVFPYLSATTRDRVSRFLTDGLAEYVYYYPGTPSRLRQNRASASQVDPDVARKLVDEWVTLFTKILCAGYFPCVLSNQDACCVMDQNACMNGGFVDVDSAERMTEDPLMFEGNLLLSVQMLAHSISLYLAPEEIAGPFLRIFCVFGGSLHPTLFLPHVWRMVENKLREFGSAGIPIEPRLQAMFGNGDGWSAMTNTLGQLAPVFARP